LAVVRCTFKVRIRSTPGGFCDLETTFGVRDGDLKQQVALPVIACADQSHGVAASGLCRLWGPPPAQAHRDTSTPDSSDGIASTPGTGGNQM
jgi:hypothetical protein